MKKNFTNNESVMIAQYQGLNVTELDELRKDIDRDLRNFNKLTDINVVFNKLSREFLKTKL
mgnify:CR=1 FL=1